MNSLQFEKFLNSMVDMTAESLNGELLGKLNSAIKKANIAVYAKEFSQYATMGLAVTEMCYNSTTDSIQMKVIAFLQKILNPVISTLNKIRILYLIQYQLAQAWASIPTWDQIEKMVKDEIEKTVFKTIQAGIAELIEMVVCGSKFQKISFPSLKGFFNETLILTAVLSALKTQYEAANTA